MEIYKGWSLDPGPSTVGKFPAIFFNEIYKINVDLRIIIKVKYKSREQG